MGRAERRSVTERYRRVDVTHTCDILTWAAGGTLPVPCGVSLGATFVVERGEPTPAVTFQHHPDGSHSPVLGGQGIAAQARRRGHVIGQEHRTVTH